MSEAEFASRELSRIEVFSLVMEFDKLRREAILRLADEIDSLAGRG